MQKSLDEFISLTKKKKMLMADLKSINEELDIVGRAVTDEFIDSGTQHISKDGMTVYLTCTMSCKAKEAGCYPAIAASLLEEGYGDMVTVSHGKLKSLLREMDEQDRPLPRAVVELMDVDRIASVACRKS